MACGSCGKTKSARIQSAQRRAGITGWTARDIDGTERVFSSKVEANAWVAASGGGTVVARRD